MGILNPTKVRLSPHFLLSDMMGNDSVYSKGLPNVFDKSMGADKRITNGKALCEKALEPILAMIGPLSISYGFISPAMSKEIVTYQDWKKPSHHRWDLGAAVDICPHNWVQGLSHAMPTEASPIEFALAHLRELPLSRLITYSESPFLCVAVSDDEVVSGRHRMAWYENRYEGVRGARPDYRKYPSEALRERAFQELCRCGLEHPWEGAGFPTYHGGGRRQLHHVRASKYTMMSDWLYDEEWVTGGVKNVPSMADADVQDAFRRVGEYYDYLVDTLGYPRFSIVSGYTSPRSPGWVEHHDWRGDRLEFELVPPAYLSPGDVILELVFKGLPKGCYIKKHPHEEDRLLLFIER